MKPIQNNQMSGRQRSAYREPQSAARIYESNGPALKIRGNARQVAERYLQLAHDAHVGSDAVAAENYLQHAEHYLRLWAAAQVARDDDIAMRGQSSSTT